MKFMCFGWCCSVLLSISCIELVWKEKKFFVDYINIGIFKTFNDRFLSESEINLSEVGVVGLI